MNILISTDTITINIIIKHYEQSKMLTVTVNLDSTYSI